MSLDMSLFVFSLPCLGRGFGGVDTGRLSCTRVLSVVPGDCPIAHGCTLSLEVDVRFLEKAMIAFDSVRIHRT